MKRSEMAERISLLEMEIERLAYNLKGLEYQKDGKDPEMRIPMIHHDYLELRSKYRGYTKQFHDGLK